MKGTMLPIANGTLEIYDADTNALLASSVSDLGGTAWIAALPCPKRSESPPYRRVTVIARADGFSPLNSVISVFDGVTSYQSFPLSAKKEE